MFYADTKEKYELSRHGAPLEFQFVGGKSFLLNAPVAYNVRAKRNALKKIYPRYEAFLSWVQVVLAVTETFSTEETDPSFERFASSLGYVTAKEYQDAWGDKDLTQAERDDMWDERYARDALPFGYGYNDWRRGTGFNPVACEKIRQMMTSSDPHEWVDVLHISAAQAGKWVWANPAGRRFGTEACLDWVQELLKFLHRDEVFDLVRLPKGAVPSRTNTKYYKVNNFVPRKLRQVVGKSI
jgi:hypothetical protein